LASFNSTNAKVLEKKYDGRMNPTLVKIQSKFGAIMLRTRQYHKFGAILARKPVTEIEDMIVHELITLEQ
jgi:hypothetical protein